jgi:hypothetical protein
VQRKTADVEKMLDLFLEQTFPLKTRVVASLSNGVANAPRARPTILPFSTPNIPAARKCDNLTLTKEE